MDIVLTSQCWNSLQQMQSYTGCAIICDHSVAALYGNTLQAKLACHQIPVHQIIVPAGEKFKTLESASHCWSEMHRLGLDRQSLVIGFGGGVVTDLAGFVAGCYMRGVDLIHIPTTLMGMVDAAMGGKSGVNLTSGKNLVGVFHHPKQVIIAAHYLNTLPQQQFCAGIAEVIKYGVVWDPMLFEYLENSMSSILQRDMEKLNYIISKSCEIKAHIVKKDEKEYNLRAILNWGHTFAHAIETLTGYEKYLHGEAVAIGMCCAAQVSHHLGYVDSAFVNRQAALCQAASLPVALPKEISIEALISQMCKDKKNRSGKISLIIARQIGKVIRVDDLDKKFLQEALYGTH